MVEFKFSSLNGAIQTVRAYHMQVTPLFITIESETYISCIYQSLTFIL